MAHLHFRPFLLISLIVAAGCITADASSAGTHRGAAWQALMKKASPGRA